MIRCASLFAGNWRMFPDPLDNMRAAAPNSFPRVCLRVCVLQLRLLMKNPSRTISQEKERRMAADESPRPIGDATTAGAGNAGLISSEYFSVQRSTFTPPSCSAVSVNCEVLRCSGSGALFCHAASAPQAEMVRSLAARQATAACA